MKIKFKQFKITNFLLLTSPQKRSRLIFMRVFTSLFYLNFVLSLIDLRFSALANTNCINKDLRNPAVGIGRLPARDQGPVGSCYAEVAADLIDHVRFSTAPPRDGTINSYHMTNSAALVMATLNLPSQDIDRRSILPSPSGIYGLHWGRSEEIYNAFKDNELNYCKNTDTLYNKYDAFLEKTAGIPATGSGVDLLYSSLESDDSPELDQSIKLYTILEVISEELRPNQSRNQNFSFDYVSSQIDLMIQDYFNSPDCNSSESGTIFSPTTEKFRVLYANCDTRNRLISFIVFSAYEDEEYAAYRLGLTPEAEVSCNLRYIPGLGEVDSLANNALEILRVINEQECDNSRDQINNNDTRSTLPNLSFLLFNQDDNLSKRENALVNNLVSALNDDNPLAVGLCANFLKPGNSIADDHNFDSDGNIRNGICNGERTNHDVSFIGMRQQGNQCQVLIRNSWGENWTSPRRQCDRGACWFNLEDVTPNIYQLGRLQRL